MSNLDCWEAETSDGRQWREDDPALQVAAHSAWRELEAVCQRVGLTVLWARVNLPERFLRMDGPRLTCGELLTQAVSLTGGGNVTKRYRWVRRDEPGRSLWSIIGAEGAWQYETPPGQQACPEPGS